MSESAAPCVAEAGRLRFGPGAPGGRLISIDGMDGAGKTTLAGLLQAQLEAKGLEVVGVRVPSGWMRGLACFEQVQRHGRLDLFDPVAFEVAYMADRINLCRTVVVPALLAGRWVIADRYVLSSLGTLLLRLPALGQVALQAVTKQAWFAELCQYLVRPDLALVLAVAPELGVSRLQLRPDEPDAQVSPAAYDSLQQVLLRVARQNDMAVIDGGRPIQETLQASLQLLKGILPGKP